MCGTLRATTNDASRKRGCAMVMMTAWIIRTRIRTVRNQRALPITLSALPAVACPIHSAVTVTMTVDGATLLTRRTVSISPVTPLSSLAITVISLAGFHPQIDPLMTLTLPVFFNLFLYQSKSMIVSTLILSMSASFIPN